MHQVLGALLGMIKRGQHHSYMSFLWKKPRLKGRKQNQLHQIWRTIDFWAFGHSSVLPGETAVLHLLEAHVCPESWVQRGPHHRLSRGQSLSSALRAHTATSSCYRSKRESQVPEMYLSFIPGKVDLRMRSRGSWRHPRLLLPSIIHVGKKLISTANILLWDVPSILPSCYNVNTMGNSQLLLMSHHFQKNEITPFNSDAPGCSIPLACLVKDAAGFWE